VVIVEKLASFGVENQIPDEKRLPQWVLGILD
jgi:hypothetical protein